MGTPRYMAPEQLKGLAADQRSDVFAFGAVVYELLTGSPAFPGDSQADLIAAVLKGEPEPLTKLSPGVALALDHLVRTCLAKNPDERYGSMRDVLLQLECIADGGSRPDLKPLTAQFDQPIHPMDWALVEMPAVSPDGRSIILTEQSTVGPYTIWNTASRPGPCGTAARGQGCKISDLVAGQPLARLCFRAAICGPSMPPAEALSICVTPRRISTEAPGAARA